MNILIDIAHPAHVHLTKNVYFELTKRGHKVIVTVKNIPSAISLLKLAGIPYRYIGGKSDSLWGKAFLQIGYYWRILKIIYTERIDMGFASSITLPHLAKVSKMKSIILDDDDDDVEPLFVKYAHPYADVVLSPDCLTRATDKLITYPGYHELAYLHPRRFRPDESVLHEIGVEKDEPYFILRFNAFKAHHDVGVKGLSIDDKRKLIAMLEAKGKVFITTERNIDEEFSKYQLKVSPDKAHSLIYYATMLVGDSQTMTSEAAVLGTPAIRCNTFAGKIAYLEEEEHKYQLTYGFHPDDAGRMFEKIEELLQMPNLKAVWAERRAKLLADKIDVTSFFVWFIENYPGAVTKLKLKAINFRNFS
jgi:predicted glycosyltransferase